MTQLSDSTDLVVHDASDVRTVTLHRPSSKNGLTVPMVVAIADAIEQVPAGCRALVIRGEGGAFCSGLDLKAALAQGLTVGPALEANLRGQFHRLIRALTQAPFPTVAAVDGIAAGFGCDIALACDLRVGSTRAAFGEIFVRRGLMPDGGGTYLLPRIVGLGRALDMLLTGSLVQAEEALRIGLLSRLWSEAEFQAAFDPFVASLASGPPLVYRRIKQSVYAGLADTLDDALDREAQGQMALLASEDFAEGVASFLQKRPAKFTGK